MEQAKEMARVAFEALEDKKEKTPVSLISRISRYLQIILLYPMGTATAR